jgi:pilus assembly protein CpaE
VNNIKVLVVDDIVDTGSQISKLLAFEPDMDVVGFASSGQEALELTRNLQPDVVLLDINMPDLDGIETAERLTRQAPAAAIVMMSVNGEADYVRRAMLAGARAYLIKPFSSDELFSIVRDVYVRRPVNPALVPMGPGSAAPVSSGEAGSHRVVAFFSPKGGVGTSTLAVNTAVAAAELQKSVAIVDASLQFGDVGVLLNLNPLRGSVADLLPELQQGVYDGLDTGLMRHPSGVSVLLAPASPEIADMITTDILRRTLERLRAQFELVVVDCPPLLNDHSLAVLDVADSIVCVLSLDITAIKSGRAFVEVADRLGYGEDKLHFVLNRADSSHGIRIEDVERSLGRKVESMVVSDGRAALHALNHGIPFVTGNKRAHISQDVLKLTRAIFGETPAIVVEEPAPKAPVERRLAFARR